ncbi:MAG: ATP-dependent helicase [Actinobacteria bacterium]|nr:ATP-dependent helicase [Actinomycetota bacterium]
MTMDAAQRSVVELEPTASGVVIGAPGTGKTEALIARVAALLAAGAFTADELLVLTPTRQTATALRDRLAIGVGQATSGPLGRSVASFAYQLVRAAAVQRGEEPPRLLTAGDQDRIIAEMLAGDDEDAAAGFTRWPDELPSPVRSSRSFRTEMRALFAECAELGIEAPELSALSQATGRPSWVAAASFLGEYRETLGAMRAAHRDPADLVAEAAALLRSAAPGSAAEATLGPPARLRVVLVDDAQELTRGGIALLRALRVRGVAVLAFGDPDIGSGAFRGASPALFAQLCDLLGAVHVLATPYRGAPALTRLTRTITSSIGAAGRVEHRRAPGPLVDEGASVRAIVAPSPFEEIDRIARTLREWHVLDDVPWGRLAVIAHDTRQVAELEVELAAREVPTRAAGVQRPLGREQVVRDVVEIVRLGITAPAERDPDVVASALLSPFGGLDAVGLRRLRARLRHAELSAEGTRPARELLAEAMRHPLELGLIDTPEARAAERLATAIAKVHAEAQRGATVHDLLWLVWDAARDASGRRLADAWRDLATGGGVLASEVDHALDALVALFDAAKRFVERSLDEGPGPFIHRILDSDVPEDILTAPERPDTVTLLTPAAALGTEFEGVVIAGVQDGIWPNVRLRGGLLDSWRLADDVSAWRSGETIPDIPAVLDRRRAALHDELRLLVRAVSRSRSRLVVTAVDDDDLGPSPLFSFLPEPGDEPDGPTVPQHPLTLRGLVAQHRRTLTSSAANEPRTHAAAQLVLLGRARVAGAMPHDWYGVAAPTSTAPLRDPARGPVHVSPSKLEGFAECPLDWAVRALGGDTRSWSAGVGTILHAALEEVPGGDAAALQAIVDDRWGELDFEAPWMSRKEHDWATLLVGRLHTYLDRFHREGGRTIGAEARFRIGVDMDAAPDTTPALIPADETAGRRIALLSGSVDRVEVYPNGRGEGIPLDADRADAERVVIVDLKTGRSEKRVSDDKVTDDPQLAAYQLAFLAGEVPGADPRDNAGARLLVLSKTLKGTHYRLARQEPMDDERRSAFLRSIVDAAAGMASDRFDAHLDTHCMKHPFAVCPVHTVKAVSAS